MRLPLFVIALFVAFNASAAPPPCNSLLWQLGLSGYRRVFHQQGYFQVLERVSVASLVGQDVRVEFPRRGRATLDQGAMGNSYGGEVRSALFLPVWGLRLSLTPWYDEEKPRTITVGRRAFMSSSANRATEMWTPLWVHWNGVYALRPIEMERLIGKKAYLPAHRGVSLAPEPSPQSARTVLLAFDGNSLNGNGGEPLPREFLVRF